MQPLLSSGGFHNSSGVARLYEVDSEGALPVSAGSHPQRVLGRGEIRAGDAVESPVSY